MSEGQSHVSSAAEPHHVAAPASTEAARQALRYGPRGALMVGSIALAILLAGWLAFYFLLFLPRGGIG